MAIVNVTPDRWRAELDSFSLQHEGWIVSVTRRGPDGTVGVQARDVPLRGVTQASPHVNRIVVATGTGDGQLIHEIPEVTAVAIDFTAERAKRALVLESHDGSTTTVTFRSPARPEEVDGVAVEHS